MTCSLGMNGSSNMCISDKCSVCRIIRHGFSIKKEIKGGIGVFTTSTSGRVFESIELYEETPFVRKALIVCRVIAGRVHKPLESIQGLAGQTGFDSLVGKVGLYSNIEELYLLSPRALLPCFVAPFLNAQDSFALAPATKIVLLTTSPAPSENIGSSLVVIEELESEHPSPACNIATKREGSPEGSFVHSKVGLNSNLHTGNALVDLYAKCGSVKKAHTVLFEMERRNVISWTYLIFGLAVNGFDKEAIELLVQLDREALVPTEITFVGVWYAGSHYGMVDQGFEYFKRMREVYRIMPKIEHYGCIVDLFGRDGLVQEAHDFIQICHWNPMLLIGRLYLELVLVMFSNSLLAIGLLLTQQ
ncbi:pentatricopeptide repeat-containing protein At3g09040, mitochondrial-like [Telopea speciosissima]|uniref:pentatricopeptide repeat-containing protein At3g09040, mitochondrial-like n=1 Tax=Telopea speciosissima TaxID=54955 RepID=UPI001CC633BE|nr:pentatricopeptide repeat-containing protein At3g09040, mitochondrial-like [Telopea speciosissima]